MAPFVAPKSPKCPKCGDNVYAAEQREAGGLKWHSICFKCGKSNSNPLYPCRPCMVSARRMVPAKRSRVIKKSFLSFITNYIQKQTGMCGKPLDSTNCSEHENELYCQICHGRKFGIKGYGFGQGAGTLNMDAGEHFGT